MCQFLFRFLLSFLSLSFTQPSRKNDLIRTAKKLSKYRDARKTSAEHSALINLQNQLQWLGFGLSVGHSALNRDQTLGLRSIIPLQTALHCLGQGEKQCNFATHLEYRAFRFNASANIHLRLSETTSETLRDAIASLLIIDDSCPKRA